MLTEGMVSAERFNGNQIMKALQTTREMETKKKLTFQMAQDLLPNDQAVHVVHHGRVVATIYPDDEQNCAIVVSSPNIKDFTKQVAMENGSETPARAPSVVITLTPRK